MSSKIWLIILVLGVLGGAFVVSRTLKETGAVEGKGRTAAASTLEQSAIVDAPPADPNEGALSGAAALSAPVAQGEDRSADLSVVAAVAAPAVGEGRCALRGRVLDAGGEPIPGVVCRLGARRRWSKAKEAGAFDVFGPTRKEKWVGFEVITAEDGAFFIEAPIPTAKRAELFLDAGPFFSYATVGFGKGGSLEPPLTGGLRELADVTLSPAGAASGAVLADNGEPIAEARVFFAAVESDDRVHADTDEQGAFFFQHLPPGDWRMHASAKGLMDSITKELTISAGNEQKGLLLELSLAPVVRGRVVTGELEPVVGATVYAKPMGAPRTAKSTQARTDDEGQFELTLPTRLEFALTTQHPEYRPAAGAAPRVAGDQDGVTLTMKPLARVFVSAVDGETGEPLEAFGVLVVKDAGSKASAPEYGRRSVPRVKKVKEGYVEVFGRPGRDLLIIAAEGYPIRYADLAGATWVDSVTRPTSSPAQFKAPGAEAVSQVISMPQGSTLQGRTLAQGVPVPSTVTISRAQEEDNLFVTLQRKGQTTTVEADGETGQFTFADLAPGRYIVQAQSKAGSIGTPPVEVRLGETTNLGDLELSAGGTIVGQIQVAPTADVNGLVMEVVDLVGLPKVPVDEEGRFRMENIPAGLRTIRQGTFRRDFMVGGDVQVNVPSGGEVLVSLDLTSFHIVPVKLQIEVNGQPRSGVEVRLVDESFWPKRRTTDFTEKYEAYLGRSDGEGRVTAYGRARGVRIPVIHINDWSVIAHPTARIDMNLGVPVDERIAFSASSLAVVLPESAELPKFGSLRIKLVSKENPAIWSQVTVGFDDDEIEESFGVEYLGAEAGWRLGVVAPGSWRVTASIFDERIAPNRIGQGDAVYGTNSEARAEFSGDAELAKGGDVTVVLE